MLDPIDDTICIANYNSPVQYVISGTSNAIDIAVEACENAGAKRAIKLPVSGAFHSPLMQSAVESFKSIIDSKTFKNASIPIYLNRTAKPESDASALKDNLSQQIISSVQWVKTINEMSTSGTSFIEIGPGKVLSGLVKKINREYTVKATSSLEQTQSISQTEEVSS